jgi:hypothetical protein
VRVRRRRDGPEPTPQQLERDQSQAASFLRVSRSHSRLFFA